MDAVGAPTLSLGVRLHRPKGRLPMTHATLPEALFLAVGICSSVQGQDSSARALKPRKQPSRNGQIPLLRRDAPAHSTLAPISEFPQRARAPAARGGGRLQCTPRARFHPLLASCSRGHLRSKLRALASLSENLLPENSSQAPTLQARVPSPDPAESPVEPNGTEAPYLDSGPKLGPGHIGFFNAMDYADITGQDGEPWF